MTITVDNINCIVNEDAPNLQLFSDEPFEISKEKIGMLLENSSVSLFNTFMEHQLFTKREKTTLDRLKHLLSNNDGITSPLPDQKTSPFRVLSLSSMDLQAMQAACRIQREQPVPKTAQTVLKRFAEFMVPVMNYFERQDDTDMVVLFQQYIKLGTMAAYLGVPRFEALGSEILIYKQPPPVPSPVPSPSDNISAPTPTPTEKISAAESIMLSLGSVITSFIIMLL